jgi:hypothetical protein
MFRHFLFCVCVCVRACVCVCVCLHFLVQFLLWYFLQWSPFCWNISESMYKTNINPFTAEVAIMRLLGSAPMLHLCDQKRRSTVTGLSDLMTLFIDLGCLYCKQTQRAFNVFKNTQNWLKIDSVDWKLKLHSWTYVHSHSSIKISQPN